jgi:ethanolamine utilization protein EutK
MTGGKASLMGTIHSLGLLEVRGLTAGIEAADALLKSARVRLLRQHQVNPGLITLVVEGDMAACRASVDAGVAAASRIGEVISQRVIGAPDEDTDDFVLALAERSARPFAVPGGGGKTPPEKAPLPPEPAAAAASSLAEVIDFLSRAARGFTLRELGERFPDLPPDIRGELDRAVKDGRLDKAGGHYRAARGDEPASSATRRKRTK